MAMVQITKSDDLFRIKFGYNPELIKKVKTIKGYRWTPEGKYWTVPYSEGNLAELMTIFKEDKIELDDPLKDFPNVKNQTAGVIQKLEEELKVRGYSPKTRKAYRNHILAFSLFAGVNLPEVNNEQIHNYLLYLVDIKKVSNSYINQTVSAIKFLYGMVLKCPKIIAEVPRPRKEHKLPVVLSRQEVIALLQAEMNPKHRLLIMITYSAGLRVSEVVRLKTKDIDYERGLIFIRQAKGKKDRYTTLSSIVIEELHNYCKLYRPIQWLFPGMDDEKHLNIRTAEKILEKARDRAGIAKQASMHTLRHYVESEIMGSVA
jgi:site-specific recombinase XerD